MNDSNKAVRVSTRLAQQDTDNIARLATKRGLKYPEMVAEVIRAGLTTINTEEQSINASKRPTSNT